jgi:D-inositol-3-phosphate glycosyltransferase
MTGVSTSRRSRRVAMIVVHSNPLIEPGVGDAGGMTVYVREVARSLAAHGAEVDIFTRRESEGPPVTELTTGVRVLQVDAGSPEVPKEDLPTYLPEFTARLKAVAEAEGTRYDVLHSHYWLSGRVAAKLSDRWGIPFVHTFHTLGRVKNGRLRRGEQPESRGRLPRPTSWIP